MVYNPIIVVVVDVMKVIIMELSNLNGATSICSVVDALKKSRRPRPVDIST